ncbi:inhibitor of KinA [Paenibacillus sophorae]|uniref:5-oxoprolinase subunit PxpB n=1 Tax=Paenibacillus sophorae TaxID=1333845 RepID=A0A1H8UMQ2_9BACL|nr:5-oxoprolinase subunit PxpB [Paenibacillus sophorae]QWU13307.1 5-oxoprolinase subunit PxpB [Paenibacillus sophorae]SEP04287.1 inhibitor of KinA [Paenibacillus sophorae]
MAWSFYPLGDSAVSVEFGQSISAKIHKEIRAAVHRIEIDPFPGFIECVPSFAAISVFYDLAALRIPDRNRTAFDHVCSILRDKLMLTGDGLRDESTRIIDIPVCYGGEFGPDLGLVAESNGLSEEEVVSIHAGEQYLVYAIGFAPGFPYLGGMPDTIAAPRKKTPRLRIPAGSVGIAGSQTGIYPIETPGGWQIIGRTPLELFRPDESPPTLLQGGDYIRFRPIGQDEYLRLRRMQP